MRNFLKGKLGKVLVSSISLLLIAGIAFSLFLTVRYVSKGESEREFYKNVCGSTWQAATWKGYMLDIFDLTAEEHKNDGTTFNNIKFSILSDSILLEYNSGEKYYLDYTFTAPDTVEFVDRSELVWEITYSEADDSLIVSTSTEKLGAIGTYCFYRK